MATSASDPVVTTPRGSRFLSAGEVALCAAFVLGIVDSGVAGLVLAAAYFLARRNLWAPVLAHGFIDTVAVVSLTFGWTT